VALTTGSWGGLGRPITRELADHGAKVVVNYYTNEEAAEELAAELKQKGQEHVTIQAGVAHPDDCQRLSEETVKQFGGLDILINNAGVNRDRTIRRMTAEEGRAVVATAAETVLNECPLRSISFNTALITLHGLLFRMSEADWNDVISTNLSSCFHWTKHLARPMTRARWGRIVNITSVSGIMGNAGQANYSAAKAGMIGLTKSLAREFAGRHVTVNAVTPGFIKPDMTTDLLNKPEITAQIPKTCPLKPFG